MAKNKEYEKMIETLFKIRTECDDEKDTRTLNDYLRHFPIPYSLRHRVYDLKEPLSDILKWKKCALRLPYEAMVLHSVCRNEEWRRRFVRRDGLNYLLEMLFLCGLTITDCGYELAVTYIASVLYMICYGHCPTAYPRHVFLHSVLMMMKKHQR